MYASLDVLKMNWLIKLIITIRPTINKEIQPYCMI
jgi:hypothetical protein